MIVVNLLVQALALVVDVLMVPLLLVGALLSRVSKRSIDVGLGPEPLINNCYHKKALVLYGYSAETFVDHVYFITNDFDVRMDRLPRFMRALGAYLLFFRAIFRYRALYLYFNGGPLFSRPITWRLEPVLYKIAGVKTMLMPYGGDVQDMTRSPNLLFRAAMASDYPQHGRRRRRVASQIDNWSRWASHIVSGVEWVDYMSTWDTLMLGHFSIDIGDGGNADATVPEGGPLRIFHAPNHRSIKGTDYLVKAVEELKAEGVDLELAMLQKVPNEQVREAIRTADLIADQFVVGWYAMFALEAMSSGKPVLCYLRSDLVELYTAEGLIERDEIPLINCDIFTVKDTIRHFAEHREELPGIGRRGVDFVRKHHSLEAVGAVFDRINRGMGIEPNGRSTDKAVS
jgi:glycosyltransferase involved in cell wall biosynthesis